MDIIWLFEDLKSEGENKSTYWECVFKVFIY